jgi:hypothetical protein
MMLLRGGCQEASAYFFAYSLVGVNNISAEKKSKWLPPSPRG